MIQSMFPNYLLDSLFSTYGAQVVSLFQGLRNKGSKEVIQFL